MNFLGGRSFNNNTRTTHLLKYKLETQAACGGSRLSSSADRLSWPKWTLDCFDSLDFGHLGWINTVCHRPRQQKKKTAHLQKKAFRNEEMSACSHVDTRLFYRYQRPKVHIDPSKTLWMIIKENNMSDVMCSVFNQEHRCPLRSVWHNMESVPPRLRLIKWNRIFKHVAADSWTCYSC